MDREIDIHYYRDDGEDWEEDSDGYHRGYREIHEQRQLRPQEEREAIELGETFWNAKVAEQKEKESTNHAALVRMFEHMPNLRRIEVTEWSCNLVDHGIVDDTDEAVGHQFARSATAWSHLELLSSALQTSNKHIGDLVLPSIDAQMAEASPALMRLFSSLKILSFDLESVKFMLTDSNPSLSPFATLLQSARQTLKKILVKNHAARHPQLPEIGEHALETLFGEPCPDPASGIMPLVFSNLQEFTIRSVILNAPSLIAFLARQNALRTASFEYIFLTTIGLSWNDVVASLPPTCTSLHISHCGQELPSSPSAAYNHSKPFKPYENIHSMAGGWRINESFLEQQLLQQWAHGPVKEEYVALWRMNCRNVKFEKT